MAEIKAIIFDLDGVIVFTDEYHYLAWKKIADDLGIPFDREKNNRLRGISRMESLDIVLGYGDRKFSNEKKQRLAEEKNLIYRGLLEQMTENDLDAETYSTMNRLRSRGLKLAIGSSSRNAKTILEKIGLSDYFDAISDGTNISKTKPDPEVFLKAAEFLGVAPEYCVVVEDALAGIEAGHNAEMRTIAVGDAKNSGLATWKINCFSDIIPIVQSDKPSQ